MQHLISSYLIEEDVENETTTENLLHRRTKGRDVGSLAEKENEMKNILPATSGCRSLGSNLTLASLKQRYHY